MPVRPLLLALALAAPLGLAAPAAAAPPFPTFTVTLTDGDAHPLPGETYTYRATVRNDGAQVVRGSRFVVTIPYDITRLRPQTVRTDAGQVTIGNIFGGINSLISVELGAMSPGELKHVSWAVRLLPPEGPDDAVPLSFQQYASAERTADDGFPDTIAGSEVVTTEPSQQLSAPLSGGQVQPGPGDPDGSGNAELTLVGALGDLCARVQVRRVALPAVRTVLSVEGRPEVVLPGPDRTGVARGCVQVDPESTVQLVFGTPATVRVDNAPFPAGAVAASLAPAARAPV